MSIEVVSVGVEVPNPGSGFGTFRKRTIEVSGLAEQLKGRRVVDLDEFALANAPTLWWADGHRVVPRGTGIEVEGHPSDGPESAGAPGTAPQGIRDRASGRLGDETPWQR